MREVGEQGRRAIVNQNGSSRLSLCSPDKLLPTDGMMLFRSCRRRARLLSLFPLSPSSGVLRRLSVRSHADTVFPARSHNSTILFPPLASFAGRLWTLCVCAWSCLTLHFWPTCRASIFFVVFCSHASRTAPYPHCGPVSLPPISTLMTDLSFIVAYLLLLPSSCPRSHDAFAAASSTATFSFTNRVPPLTSPLPHSINPNKSRAP
jgi:hypothetical protein